MQAIESHCAASQYLMLCFGRQWLEPFAEHLRRPGKKAILVRIIGRPHDLVWSDIVRQYGNAALNRLERDPAIAPEQLAGPCLGCGFVEAVVVKMPVHAVEPGRNPAATRLQERDAQSRVTVDDAAPD